MRRVPLTDLAIQKLKPPTTGQLEIFDSKAPGLSLRVGSTGAKTFCLTYRLRGERKRRRGKIGRYPEISLSKARSERIDKLAQANKGVDPFEVAGSRAVDVAICGFDACVERFIIQYVLPNSKTPENPIRILRNEFVAAWGCRDVRGITKADILRVLHGIRERGAPVAANRALARVRKLFTWLVHQDEFSLIEHSPCVGLKRLSKERSRDRVLNGEELGAVWRAADKLGYPYGSYFKLLTLLGQRRTEIASMRWAEIEVADDKAGLWRMPSRTPKNEEAHVLPLPRLAVTILRDCPRIGDSPFVFPSAHHNEKHLTGFSKWKDKLDDLSGVLGWTPHDLRRTQASIAPSLGISEVLVEQIHNHKLPRTHVSVSGKIYNRYRYVEEMRAALELYSEHIESAIA